MIERIGPSTYFNNELIDTLPEAERSLISRRNSVLASGYRLFYDQPIEFVRGNGARLFTANGEEFLDVYNNVPVVGHSNEHVLRAMLDQARLVNSHTRYLHEGIVSYAEDLLRNFSSELNRVAFTCTGSESNDLALRMANQLTGNSGVIVTNNAYHGVTKATAEVSPSLVGLKQLPNWVFRVRPPLESAEAFKSDVQVAILELNRLGFGVAAILLDTVFASDGAWVGSEAEGKLMAEAFDSVRAAGGLVIVDEVQAGFGRLGTNLFGFQRYGWQPDLVSLGKPIANGQPVGGLVGKAELFEKFGSQVRYFNTFAGTPVSMAAAHATLRQIFDLALLPRVAQLGLEFEARLKQLSATFSEIGEVRGGGLYWAVDLIDSDGNPNEPLARTLVNELRLNRVLISASGPSNASLKIRPPLVFSEDDLEVFFERLLPSLLSAIQLTQR